ncbi:ABC transporter ATP-binding protein [Mesorhizobium xinjiangense]|uniref:ABC transporter ATP-binding protein n=1 Tax=Mesorhizobium xinjiangense TaxID=2678685 RepID=UPI0012EDFEBB|nr:ABC transporter ATP-binding protein [Mesorhizobium xinjiangense]
MIFNAPQPTLSVSDIRIGMRGSELIKGVSFDVHPGQVVALVGESGSGKTMIGRAVLRLLPDVIRPTSGDILYHGTSILSLSQRRMRALRGEKIGMVFQEPLVSLNPAMRIGRQMAEAMRLHTSLSPAEIRERSIAMLRRIQISDPEACLAAYPHQFSGGMRQRIMLASVMLLRPDLLIADEPTTALDTLSQLEVLETMMDLTRDVGTSVLLITHNLGLVAKYADYVVVLKQGEVVEAGPTRDILDNPQREYTRRLIESVPTRDPHQPQLSHDGRPSILEARNVVLSYDQGTALWARRPRKQVLRDVSLAIAPGEIVAVVGGSGSGKTTLGRAMLRLQDIDAGQILYNGQDVARRADRQLGDFRRKCQIVFQDPFSSLDPRMRVGAIVAEALRHERGLSARQRRERTEQVLSEVGLADYRRRYPHELSGGQRQRVAIARAIVSQPDVIVADEPISALDMTIQKQVLELFERLQRERGFACIFISHDLAAVQQVAQRIIVMENGTIVEEGPCDAVFENPQHEYTRRLLAASPMLARPSETRGNEKREEPVNE